MRRRIFSATVVLAMLCGFALPGPAQRRSASVTTTPQSPRSFRDGRTGVSFQVPARWDLNRRDGEVSTFALDARSALKSTQLRAVANITFNPFPQSTFAGAYFYASVTPRVSPADCVKEASAKSARPVVTENVAGVPFTHGYDEHGGVCIESRDEIYTAARSGSCYRFDLVTNNFCGGEVSGVRDISKKELDDVRGRLESILATVQFEKPTVQLEKH